MKGYFECGKCGLHHEKSGSTMASRCPKCGNEESARAEIGCGPAPDWYKPSIFKRISAALERKP